MTSVITYVPEKGQHVDLNLHGAGGYPKIPVILGALYADDVSGDVYSGTPTGWVTSRSRADSAYLLAAAGTISHNMILPVAGTVTFSMSGSAYQSVIITGTTVVTVTDAVAPTKTYIQAIVARLQHDYTGSSHTLLWDEFPYVSNTPPSRVLPGKSVFVSFTSYGATVQNVFASSASQV